jgi:ParB family chromosome partitioning protein
MNKRKALGKGLSDLISIIEEEKENFSYIPIELIVPNPNQTRHSFDLQKIDEMVQTVLEKGIISPLIVKKSGDFYELISGERRFRAAKKAGLKTVPAIIKDIDDISALEISLIENIQRENLNPIEEAEAYQKLLILGNYNHDTLSKKLGKDRSTISNSLRLLKLPDIIKEAIINGIISSAHGRTLLSLDDPKDQIYAFNIVKEKALSVRQTEILVKNLYKHNKRKNEKIKDIYIKDIEDNLKRLLSTKVNIFKTGKKGKIVIEFYSDDDLERILNYFR